MPCLTFKGQQYQMLADETVLDCLLRHGVNYPNSCQSGVCQACLIKTSEPQHIKVSWQQGLKPTLATDGYFLACQAKPEADFSCHQPSTADSASFAKIMSKKMLNHNVLCLRLTTNDYHSWKAGKYLNLVNPGGIIRSYSIANLPHRDKFIELHIKLYPNGLMADWLITPAKVGTKIQLRGPIGSCFYANPDHQPFPMILIGTGTGLAPLIGILKDALDQHHQGRQILIHGGANSEDLYFDQQLTELDQRHANFTYYSTARDSENASSLDALLEAAVQTNKDANVYVCGSEKVTNQLKMKAFLAGIASAAIYSDTFLHSAK